MSYTGTKSLYINAYGDVTESYEEAMELLEDKRKLTAYAEQEE